MVSEGRFMIIVAIRAAECRGARKWSLTRRNNKLSRERKTAVRSGAQEDAAPFGHQSSALLMSVVSGVGRHVAEHLGGVRAFGIQVRVGVVFGDAPDAGPLVPEG
jgi:hypothetical protein